MFLARRMQKGQSNLLASVIFSYFFSLKYLTYANVPYFRVACLESHRIYSFLIKCLCFVLFLFTDVGRAGELILHRLI